MQTLLSKADADRVVGGFDSSSINIVPLPSNIGYVTPQDVLAGRRDAIHTERDRKLESARERRRLARQAAHTNSTTRKQPGATVTNEFNPTPTIVTIDRHYKFQFRLNQYKRVRRTIPELR